MGKQGRKRQALAGVALRGEIEGKAAARPPYTSRPAVPLVTVTVLFDKDASGVSHLDPSRGSAANAVNVLGGEAADIISKLPDGSKGR